MISEIGELSKNKMVRTVLYIKINWKAWFYLDKYFCRIFWIYQLWTISSSYTLFAKIKVNTVLDLVAQAISTRAHQVLLIAFDTLIGQHR